MTIWPVHYAISEALIVIAAAYTVARVWPRNRWFAIGLAVTTLAALVGAIRIVLAATGSIAALHAFLSGPGSIFGLAMLVGLLWNRQPWLPLVLALGLTGLAIAVPMAEQLVFAAVLLGGATLAYRAAANHNDHNHHNHHKALAAFSFAFLIVAAVASLLLQNTAPALAWHAFHTLVALWYLLVLRFVPIPQPR